jgi:hypothetical protein
MTPPKVFQLKRFLILLKFNANSLIIDLIHFHTTHIETKCVLGWHTVKEPINVLEVALSLIHGIYCPKSQLLLSLLALFCKSRLRP